MFTKLSNNDVNIDMNCKLFFYTYGLISLWNFRIGMKSELWNYFGNKTLIINVSFLTKKYYYLSNIHLIYVFFRVTVFFYNMLY